MNALLKIEVDRPSLSLDIPKGQTFEEWVLLGRQLSASSQVINWYIGDWWAAGSHRYGARAEAAAQGIFGKEFQAMADIASVCRSFETSRRREHLTFTHHREVAALDPGQADALLEKAETEGWSTRDLRRQVVATHLRRSPVAHESANDFGVETAQGGDDRPTPDMFTMDEIVIEVLEALGRHQALTPHQSVWLERSWRRLRAAFGRQTEEWDGGQDLELKTHLRCGRDVRVISTMMERTPAALRRRIWKLGGIAKIVAESSVAPGMPRSGE